MRGGVPTTYMIHPSPSLSSVCDRSSKIIVFSCFVNVVFVVVLDVRSTLFVFCGILLNVYSGWLVELDSNLQHQRSLS